MGLFVAQLLTGLANAAALFLVASGLSLIFGVTRIVNFAHGSFYMLGAFIGYSLMQVLPGMFGFWVSVLLAGLVVGVIGVIVEICVLRPVYKAPELFQLVATFGVILVIQDLALLTWGADDVLGPRAPGLKGIVRILGEPVPKYDLALIAMTPFILFGLWYLVSRTRVGILVRAATQDREMVGALGVNQAWLFTGVFFLGATLAGLGGAIQLPKGGADLLMDFNILAAIFVVVVIGGMGSLPGAYVAAALISTLNVFGVTYLPQSTLVLMFVVMAVVLMIKPYGLFGREEVAGEHGQVGEPERPIKPAGLKVRLLVAMGILLLALLPVFGSGCSGIDCRCDYILPVCCQFTFYSRPWRPGILWTCGIFWWWCLCCGSACFTSADANGNCISTCPGRCCFRGFYNWLAMYATHRCLFCHADAGIRTIDMVAGLSVG